MAIDYSANVYRSLMKRKLIFGVPLVPLLLVIFITSLCFIALESVWVIPLGILSIVFMRVISKKDEYLLENFLFSIMESDYL